MNTEYFLSINEVSKRLELPAHTLRYWEKQFPAAVKPTTGAGGRRYYRTETVEMLDVIKDLLYNRGMTIAGVKKMIKEGTIPTGSEQMEQQTDVKSLSQPEPAVTAGTGLFPHATDIDQAIDLLERARKILQ